MIPVDSYEHLRERLTGSFSDDFTGSFSNQVRMVGLLFAKGGTKAVKEELLPNVEYFNYRSGEHIDFFWVGWRKGMDGWEFDPKAFVGLLCDIEAESAWKYSGGVDLILANAKLMMNPKIGYAPCNAFLDFGRAVVCNLDKMKKDGAIVSIESYFEDIFKFAESTNGDDPTWGFSNKKGTDVAGSALKRLLLSLVPDTISEEAKHAAHFAVKNIGKRC